MKFLHLIILTFALISNSTFAEMTQDEFNNFCNAVPKSKLKIKGAKSGCYAKIDGKFLKWMYPNTVGDIEDWVDKELLEKIISASEATTPKENSIEPSKKKKWSVSLKPATPSSSKTLAPTKSKSSVAIAPAQVEKTQSIQKDEPENLAMSREEFVELCRTAPGAKVGGNKKNTLCSVRHRGKSLSWYFPNKIGDIATQIPSIIEEQKVDSKQKELDVGKERLAKIERRFGISPKDYNESISRTSNTEFSRLEFLEACEEFSTLVASAEETSEGLVCTAITTNMRKSWSFPNKTDGLKEELKLWRDAGFAKSSFRAAVLPPGMPGMPGMQCSSKNGCAQGKAPVPFNQSGIEELRRKQSDLDAKTLAEEQKAREEEQIAEVRRLKEKWEVKKQEIIDEAKSEGRLYGFVPMNKPLSKFVYTGSLGRNKITKFNMLDTKYGGLSWYLTTGCVSTDGCERTGTAEENYRKHDTIVVIKATTLPDLMCIDHIFYRFIDDLIESNKGGLPVTREDFLDSPEGKKIVNKFVKLCGLSEPKISSEDVDRIKDNLESKYELIDEDTYDSKFHDSISVEKITYKNNGDRIEFSRYYKSRLLGNGETTHLDITYTSAEKIAYDKVAKEKAASDTKLKNEISGF